MEIMVVNPSPRPSKRKKKGAKKMAGKLGRAMRRVRRKTRSAAQKRATRKLVASNRRRRRPAPKRRRRRSFAGRAKSSTRTVTRWRTRRPARRARRRNPSPRGMIGRAAKDVFMPGIVGGVGALGLDILMGYATPMLPEAMKTGYAATLTKGIGAVVLGMIVGKVLKKPALGRQLAVGGMTVAVHNVVKPLLADAAPMIPLGDYDSYMNGWGSIGGGMSAYTGLDAYTGLGAFDVFSDTAAYTAPAMQFNVPEGMGAYVGEMY